MRFVFHLQSDSGMGGTFDEGRSVAVTGLEVYLATVVT